MRSMENVEALRAKIDHLRLLAAAGISPTMLGIVESELAATNGELTELTGEATSEQPSEPSTCNERK